MPRLKHSLPKYRLHKASLRASVATDRRDHYLGPYNFEESKVAYRRYIADYACGAVAELHSGIVSLNSVLAAYRQFCTAHYVKNGRARNEQDAIKLFIRDVRELYTNYPADQFGPKCLKSVRQ